MHPSLLDLEAPHHVLKHAVPQSSPLLAAAIVGQAQRALSARGVLDSVVEDLAERKRRLEAAGGMRARSSGSKGTRRAGTGSGRKRAAAKSGR